MENAMTTREAAKVLGLAPESVARLIREGKLEGQKFGRDWLIYRESVEKYLQLTRNKGKFDPTRGHEN